MYERIEAGTLKSRGRCKKDIMRDLLIANAHNTYLTKAIKCIKILKHS